MNDRAASTASPHREPGTGVSVAPVVARADPDFIERLLEQMPAGFVSVDDELRITFVNAAAEVAWDMPREDVIGRPLWEVFPEAQTPEVVESVVRLAQTGEPAQFELFYEPTRKWIQVFALKSTEGMSAFFLDVTEHRLAELERSVVEARYRDIVEEVPAITYIDNKFEGSGAVIYLSPQSKEILGFSPEEWRLGKSLWRDHLHPDDRDAVIEEDARCRRLGIPFEAEYRMIARDGRVVWFHDRSAPVLDEMGRPTLVHGIMVDITAHRTAEEAVRSRESILAALGFAAERLLRSGSWAGVIDEVLAKLGESAAVDRVDLIELQPDGDELRVWGRAEWCAPGITRGDDGLGGRPMPGGQTWLSVLEAGGSVAGVSDGGFEDTACPYLDDVRSYALAPLLVSSRLWGFLAFGEVDEARRWSAVEMDAIAAAAAALSAAMQRQQAETALRESEARFRRLADGAPDLVFRYRLLPTPGFEYVSQAAETMTGYAPEEFLADDQLIFRIIHPDDLPLLAELLRDFSREHTLRWVARDGHVVWTEQRFVDVSDEQGRVVAVEGIARDVSDRVESDRHLRESLEALRRSSEDRQHLLARLVKAHEEERERVANDIHDDSIQIMTAVGLRLAVLRGQVGSPAAEQTLSNAEEIVAQAIRRLRRLLFELRPMSLDNSGLVAALRDHLRLMQEPDGPEFSIDDRLGREPPPESRTILYRIAQEALTNVRKHARADLVSITLESQGEGIRMSIRDDGVGFDPASPPDGGLGHFGLPTMRERAALAGGWLRIETAPGAGTTVEFWIPRSVDASEADEPATGSDPGSSVGSDPA
jgi:PAS domain S-box-containing protein